MMSMRPFQIVLIAVFAVLALVGLYVFANFSGGSSGPDIGTVVIWGTLPHAAVDNAIDVLKQQHKEYNAVTYVEMPSATFDNDLANALAAGTGPNLIIMNQEQLLTEVPKLTLIPFSSISHATFNKTYLSIDQLYLSSDGTYGIPLVVDPLVLYYNRKLLSSEGIAAPPTALTDLPGLASGLRNADGTQAITVSAVPFGAYENVTNARAILSFLFFEAGTAITSTDTTGTHSVIGDTSVTDGSRTPAESAVDFYTEFANPGQQTYTWNRSLQNSSYVFQSGDLELYPGFASEYSSIKQANPNLEFDIAPMPQGGNGHVTYGLAYAFAFPKVNNNLTGAYDTALSLTGNTVLPSFASELGMAPAQGALLKTDPSDAVTAVYYPEALNARGWLSPAPATVDQIFSGIISGVTSGRYTTREALTNADQTLNVAL